jgi:CheY-like chemotaxis protein
MDLNEIHVLVIDDEEFMRGMVLRFLEMMGISKVTEATDGLTKLMNIQLDLIVLDIMMKPMNGLKFLKTVRIGMSDAKRDVPVIVLTGSDKQLVLGTSMA